MFKQELKYDKKFNILESIEKDSDGKLLLKLRYDLKGRIIYKENDLNNWWRIAYDRIDAIHMGAKKTSKDIFSYTKFDSHDNLVVYMESNIDEWSIYNDLDLFS